MVFHHGGITLILIIVTWSFHTPSLFVAFALKVYSPPGSSVYDTNRTEVGDDQSYSRQGKDINTDTNIIYKHHLELTHKENYFTFELIALDYVNLEKTKFM